MDQWAALDEDDSRELVDGRLEEAEVPSVVHEVIVAWLLLKLAPYFSARRGVALPSGIKLAIGSGRGRLADIVCFGPEARLPRRGVVRAAPEVVVEVLSPRARDQKRDCIAKPEDYAALGARARTGWSIHGSVPWRSSSSERMAATSARSREAAGLSIRFLACRGSRSILDAMWSAVDHLPAEEEEE